MLDDVRRLLGDEGAVDHLDADGHTALYFAAADAHRDGVQFLLQSGADPDALVTPRLPITDEKHDSEGEAKEDGEGEESEEGGEIEGGGDSDWARGTGERSPANTVVSRV